MRALGTTKRRVRAMLASEQAVLCVVGLLLAAVLLNAVNGFALMESSARPLIAYAGLQLAMCVAGALTCAIVITRRRILEMLQVKE